MPSNPVFMKSLSGTSTIQIGRTALSHLPPITPESVIHDNGCGDGAITSAILTPLSPSSYPSQIHATDIAAPLLSALSAMAAANAWPVTTALMPAQALTFPDAMFTHSIMNCALFRLSDSDAVSACQHLHRTLQPGGFGVVTAWAEVPHRAALKAAHDATRPEGSGDLVGGASRWMDGTLLKLCLENGGFENVSMEKGSAVIEVEDLERWKTGMWSALGKTEKGWIESDEENWDRALKVFDETLKKQDGFYLEADGKAKLRFDAWIAVVSK